MTFLTDLQARLEALLPRKEYESFLTAAMRVNDPWQLLEVLETEFRIPYNSRMNPPALGPRIDVTGDVYIGKDTRILNATTIEGPVYIGDNCKIGPCAYLRPGTIIGNNCHIGHSSEVKNSIILNNSNAPHRNFVGDSIMGEHVNLGNASCLANYRLDAKAIIGILENGEKGDVERRKMGAILEDRVKISCTVSLNPGTFLTEGTWAYIPKEYVKISPPKEKVA